MKSGGVAFNLQVAQVVILFDWRWNPASFIGEGLRPLYCDATVFQNSANGSAAFGTGLRRKRTTTETRIDFLVGTTPQPPVNGTSCVTQWVHFQQSMLIRFGSIGIRRRLPTYQPSHAWLRDGR